MNLDLKIVSAQAQILRFDLLFAHSYLYLKEIALAYL